MARSMSIATRRRTDGRGVRKTPAQIPSLPSRSCSAILAQPRRTGHRVHATCASIAADSRGASGNHFSGSSEQCGTTPGARCRRDGDRPDDDRMLIPAPMASAPASQAGSPTVRSPTATPFTSCVAPLGVSPISHAPICVGKVQGRIRHRQSGPGCMRLGSAESSAGPGIGSLSMWPRRPPAGGLGDIHRPRARRIRRSRGSCV